jgi:glycosyltransferase involved in cell wall biosynthesis
MALKAQAERAGIHAIENGEGPAAGGHIVNSVQFDIERFRAAVKPGAARVVHRLDGPISLLRGTPESLDADRQCFEFNRQYATSTVIQSWHTIRAIAELGFEPVRPCLIINACDPTIFFPARTPRPIGQRLRIIATAWSPNPGKGAAIYRWMDENLDPSRYEFTFVGNTAAKLKNARVIEPLPSEGLARELREHDVYITASRNDPCSNAVIEALACGLPALYLDSGGHPELVSMGGLPFSRPAQIPALLDRLRRYHAVYRRLITPTSIEDVCRRYMVLLLSDPPYLH